MMPRETCGPSHRRPRRLPEPLLLPLPLCLRDGPLGDRPWESAAGTAYQTPQHHPLVAVGPVPAPSRQRTGSLPLYPLLPSCSPSEVCMPVRSGPFAWLGLPAEKTVLLTSPPLSCSATKGEQCSNATCWSLRLWHRATPSKSMNGP